MLGVLGPHFRCGAGGGFSNDNAKSVATLMQGKWAVVVNDDPRKGSDRNFEVEMPLTRSLLLQGMEVAYRIAKENEGLNDDDAPNNVAVERYCAVMDNELAILERDLPAGMKAWAHGGNELSKTEAERDQDWMISFVEYFGHRGRLSVVGSYAAKTPLDYIGGLTRLHACLKQWNGRLGSHEGTYDQFDTYEKALAGGWIGTAAFLQDKYGVPGWITEFAGSKTAWEGWEQLYRFTGGAQKWMEVLAETAEKYLIPNRLPTSIFTAFDWRYFFAYYHRPDLMTSIGTYNRAHPVQKWEIPVATTPTLPNAGDPRWTLVNASANGTFVNVRSTPTAAGINNKVGEIGKNQLLHIIEDPALEVREGSNVWRPVKLLTGIIGWASVAVFTFAPVANTQTYDMKAYFFPDAGINVRHRFNSDEVIYTYLGTDGRSYIGKNEQWEQGWTEIINGVEYLMRGFDISNYLNPDAKTVYALFREQYRGPSTPLGDEWAPRQMQVGVPFFRHAWVQVFKNDGTPVAAGSGWDDTWIRIKKHHPTFTTHFGKVFSDVLEVQYSHSRDFTNVRESYFVARGHGYVEWTDGVMHTAALNEATVRTPGTPITLSWWNLPKITQPVGNVVTPPVNPNAEPNTQPQQVRLRSGVAANVRRVPTTTGNNPIGSIPGGSTVVIKYPEKQVNANGWNWVWCAFGSLAGWVAVTSAPMFISASETRISSAVYASQWQPSARTGLCGPTSTFMVIMGDLVKVGLKAPAEFSVDHVADWMGLGKNSFSSLQQNVDALLAYGVKARSTEVTIPVIEAEIKAGRPVICLGKYGNLPTRRDTGFVGGHILVAIGFDTDNIIVNDPDYVGSAGSGVYYPRADFARFLGEVSGTGNNPNRGILITGGRGYV